MREVFHELVFGLLRQLEVSVPNVRDLDKFGGSESLERNRIDAESSTGKPRLVIGQIWLDPLIQFSLIDS